MEYKLPPLPKTITMLSDMQSGTMEVVHIDTLRQYAEQAVAPLLAEIERLKCGEFICNRCGLRKNADTPETNF